MRALWIVLGSTALVACKPLDETWIRDLPNPEDTGPFSTECIDVVCGDLASCNPSTGECDCDEGTYGDPLEACEEVFPHQNWIGSPCGDNSDCSYEDSVCLEESDGYPDGHCSQACDLYCPDQDGAPVTFCIEPLTDTDGHCFSQCDYALYPYTDGCRPEYTCTPFNRIGTSTEKLVCVPQDWVDEQACTNPMNYEGDDDCYLDLIAMGDNHLRDLSLAVLEGVASPAEALEFLDLNFERSQRFIEDELGSTIHDNYSEGHRSDQPMRGAIVHYTAGQTETRTIQYFVGSSPHASTHFVIGSYRNGLPVQIFSHAHRTWHAGSTYNADRFGIDFANTGYLQPNGTGWVDYADTPYSLVLPLYGSEPITIEDGIPGESAKYASQHHWQPYTIYQLYSYVLILRALDLVYDLDIDAIQRHGDVADSRVDPGPALPTTYLNDLALGTDSVFQTEWLEQYRVQPDWIANHPEAR